MPILACLFQVPHAEPRWDVQRISSTSRTCRSDQLSPSRAHRRVTASLQTARSFRSFKTLKGCKAGSYWGNCFARWLTSGFLRSCGTRRALSVLTLSWSSCCSAKTRIQQRSSTQNTNGTQKTFLFSLFWKGTNGREPRNSSVSCHFFPDSDWPWIYRFDTITLDYMRCDVNGGNATQNHEIATNMAHGIRLLLLAHLLPWPTD